MAIVELTTLATEHTSFVAFHVDAEVSPAALLQSPNGHPESVHWRLPAATRGRRLSGEMRLLPEGHRCKPSGKSR